MQTYKIYTTNTKHILIRLVKLVYKKYNIAYEMYTSESVLDCITA